MKKILVSLAVLLGLAISALPIEIPGSHGWTGDANFEGNILINGKAMTATAADLNSVKAGGTLNAVDGSAITNMVNTTNFVAGYNLPAVDGSAITNLNAAKIKAGTSLTAVNLASGTNVSPLGGITFGVITNAAVTFTITNGVASTNAMIFPIFSVGGRQCFVPAIPFNGQ